MPTERFVQNRRTYKKGEYRKCSVVATTEHFGSIGKSLGRLFTQPAALTNWNFLPKEYGQTF